MASYTPLSISEMEAAFGMNLLDIPPIVGRPTLFELLRVLKQICLCARKMKSHLGPLGYLFVALDLANYQRYTMQLLRLPDPTLDAPTFAPAMDA